MIPVMIGFGVVTLIASGATLLLPLIKAAVTREQKRRRRKSKKNRPRTPSKRIDLGGASHESDATDASGPAKDS